MAGLVVLSQIMLIIGTNTSFAATATASRFADPSVEFPFGPMIICTPNGIQILYPNGDGPDGTDGEGKTWVKCPLCLMASVPFLLPDSMVGTDMPGLRRAANLVWSEGNSRPRPDGRYLNQPVRAPPFGFSI